ncbi:hypothetical protein ACF1BE_16560 [Streptomyces sp. NPDC014991]|uniref:hypothetical protein n=1 Tax=Streptomyces sp. NPDC014991 TaxID=3364935 RepID=UPI0036F4C239
MGSLRLTLCTGLLAVAALAPAAHAVSADGGSVSVTPASPVPGADVTLRVSGCTGRQGTAASAAFVADARLTGAQGSLTGETRVRTSIEPGAYQVRITCAAYAITGRITVTRAAAGRGGEPVRLPDAAASPVAPVSAGGGGTAHFATVATSGSGPGTAQAATGLALAGIAAVAVGLRARRSRGTR